jgi:hypothetical protein
MWADLRVCGRFVDALQLQGARSGMIMVRSVVLTLFLAVGARGFAPVQPPESPTPPSEQGPHPQPHGGRIVGAGKGLPRIRTALGASPFGRPMQDLNLGLNLVGGGRPRTASKTAHDDITYRRRGEEGEVSSIPQAERYSSGDWIHNILNFPGSQASGTLPPFCHSASCMCKELFPYSS